ncbi:MAG: hypothetical protein U0414_33065 [Polyangiaceae bacterium]
MPIRRRFEAVLLATSLALVASAPAPVLAQPKAAPAKPSSTSTLIERAQGMFDDQRYEESIQTLTAALVRPGNTTEEKTAILKLLAFNDIAMGRNDEADAAVRALYVADENYELSKNESPRFRDFFKKTKEAWVTEGKPGRVESGAPPPTEAIKITYSPPAQAEVDTLVKIEGKVEDAGAQVEKVQLAVKNAKGKYEEKPLIFSMGSFRGEIPAASVHPPLVEYYILALDKNGLPLASRGDVDAPLRIAVPEKSTPIGKNPAFWIPFSIGVVGVGVLVGVLVYTQTQDPTITPPALAKVTIKIGE